MKTRRKSFFAACMVFLLFGMLLMPFAEGAEPPKGFVDPVSTLDMKRGDLNVFAEFWERLEEISLVPYEANVAHFDSFLYRAENRRFHPVSAPPLVIKRGEILPEYRIDLSYGPVEYTLAKSTSMGECSGEFVMKNIQFGNTEANAILYNVGGSCAVTTRLGDTSPDTINFNILETQNYGSHYHLPEASYAAVCTIEADDPATLVLSARGDRESQDGSPTRTIIVHFRVNGVKLAKAGAASKDKVAATVDTRADKGRGETSTSIPAALAIVIIGAGAALAGAGAGGSEDAGDNNSKKKSRYKMCLNKDFGDAIRYDAQPVSVYARIVETTPEGDELDRPDLSADIEMFSGGGLKVESTAISGNYMGALVCAESVPGEQKPDNGILSIRFSGGEGSFQNNVSFRLVGDAYIHFPERGKELTPTTYMLYGDNGEYQLPIELRDFTIPPQRVRLEMPGDQPFTAEAKMTDDTHYVIHLQNTSQVQTEKVQPQQIFTVTIYAQNEKESAHDSFLVNLLPEGLSLRPFTGCPIDENGRLHVACSLAPEQGEDETEIEQTHFQLVLAVSKTDESEIKSAALVDPSQISCQFEPMTAQTDKLQNLLKAFSYEIDSHEASSAGIYRICPKRQLPQDDRLDYDVALPVSCDYENQTYELLIPLRLLGDKLLPMAEKSEEIKLLIKRIRKFVDEEDRAELIREFKKDLPKMSATDVRLLSKSLVYATRAEVYKANRHLLNAQMLDWVCWGLEWYKWIGDQAISVIISKLSYNYAPFVEAIVMPAKDLLVQHMGIWLSDYISGAPSPGAALDFDQLESTGLTMIENMLTNLIDGKTEPKKAAQILSIYLVIRTANSYFYEKNDDGSPIGIYGAVASAFGDLTAQSFKIILGTKLEQLAKNPATTKMFGGYADEFVKELFPAEFYNNGGEWEFDLIKKYIEEITVLASAQIYSGIQENAEQDTSTNKLIITLIESTENPEKTVRISVTPMDLGKEFFNYIFDRLFGMFSFADSVVESPKDPPCMLV